MVLERLGIAASAIVFSAIASTVVAAQSHSTHDSVEPNDRVIGPLTAAPVHLRIVASSVVESGQEQVVQMDPARESDIGFHNEEILAFPTPVSVVTTLLPSEPADIFITYGALGVTNLKTPVQTVAANELATFHLGGLIPGALHQYQAWCKRPNEAAYGHRGTLSFRALEEDKDATVRFAFWTDSHYYQLWAQNQCEAGGSASYECVQGGITPAPYQSPYNEFLLTRKNILSDASLDFIVLGGDYAMTQCHTCVACWVSGEFVPSGTATSVQAATLQYRQTFSPEAYGAVLNRVPFVNIYGNHEGEAGFKRAACDHTSELQDISMAARLSHLANPYSVYGGDQQGRYYAFETGPVLVVVIDVMGHTTRPPQSVDDWTLGAQQLSWFKNTLATSTKKWKLVFAEHLVGGDAGPGSCYYYGRGSIKSTDNGEATGTFLGEQATIHELMRRYGSQVFFSCHDHIASIGEKLGPDGMGEGVYYVIGGRGGGIGAPWLTDPAYMHSMDFDNDGMPEYQTNVTGANAPGYMRITAEGEEALFIQYIRTHKKCNLNAKPVIELMIQG